MDCDLANAAQKTPISLLQELCAQQGMTPEYKLMSVEGAVHAPTFMYRVQVNQVVATATGQSKKKAKHAAAKAVLERLLSTEGEYPQGFVSDGVTVNAETLNEVISEPSVAPAEDDNVSGNPVGALQERCMKMRWQPPYYETEKATGLPHEKVFSIMCVVDKFTTTGEGKSKRLAKRQAADNMLKRLKALKYISDDEEEALKEKEQSNEEDELENDAIQDKVDNEESILKPDKDDNEESELKQDGNKDSEPKQDGSKDSEPKQDSNKDCEPKQNEGDNEEKVENDLSVAKSVQEKPTNVVKIFPASEPLVIFKKDTLKSDENMSIKASVEPSLSDKYAKLDESEKFLTCDEAIARLNKLVTASSDEEIDY